MLDLWSNLECVGEFSPYGLIQDFICKRKKVRISIDIKQLNPNNLYTTTIGHGLLIRKCILDHVIEITRWLLNQLS